MSARTSSFTTDTIGWCTGSGPDRAHRRAVNDTIPDIEGPAVSVRAGDDVAIAGFIHSEVSGRSPRQR